MPLPLIVGLKGPRLLDEERLFLEEARPLGIILFARNIETPEQVTGLVAECRAILGEECWVLIDQEGGRVARLRPPHWPARPAAGRIGALPLDEAEEGAYLSARLMAHDLQAIGVNVDCHPVLDVPVPGSHDIIGDRAFSADPERVAALGHAACQGLLDGGVLPVIKHVPGHGRATADSHLSLPVVTAGRGDLQADFRPFKALADMPVAMTAHVVYSAIDQDQPATQSRTIVENIIRGEIGFDGVLVTDDLTMKALTGSMADRAETAFAAGCDVALHCDGNLDEMRQIAHVAKLMAREDMADRIRDATRRLHPPKPFDCAAAQARLDQLVPATAQDAATRE